ncbi:MAG: N-acetyltransferase [Pseudomonadota bacterium]|nr:N-acetyltransferase [Pseudomonadota bacterium]
MALIIEHNSSAHRFETCMDDQLCVLDYSLDGDVMTMTHTGVPAVVGGRGIASCLTRAALTKARSEGWTVVPACSYVASWMKRHQEFDDLRA